MQVLYLWEGYEQDAVAFLSAGETQITISGVESPGCVAARMWCPHRTRRHLVELFGAGEPKQSQGVLPYCLFLEDPAKETGQGKCVNRWVPRYANQGLKRKLRHRDFLCSYKQEKSVRSCVEFKTILYNKPSQKHFTFNLEMYAEITLKPNRNLFQ